jgi:excisionase family DNA binding protein
MDITTTATEHVRDDEHVPRKQQRSGSATLPVLLTVDEAANLLRTTRRAIYAMIARRQLPGVVRIRRRVLVRADDLLHWLDQKRVSSPKE